MLRDKTLFAYRVIPADETEPIIRGAVDMLWVSNATDLRQVVEPLPAA